jgi:hypothetical protein
MPIASAITASTTCQLSEPLPSHDEKRRESTIARATAPLEKVRTLEKVLNFAVSINATVAIFALDYAKMRT